MGNRNYLPRLWVSGSQPSREYWSTLYRLISSLQAAIVDVYQSIKEALLISVLFPPRNYNCCLFCPPNPVFLHVSSQVNNKRLGHIRCNNFHIVLTIQSLFSSGWYPTSQPTLAAITPVVNVYLMAVAKVGQWQCASRRLSSICASWETCLNTSCTKMVAEKGFHYLVMQGLQNCDLNSWLAVELNKTQTGRAD